MTLLKEDVLLVAHSLELNPDNFELLYSTNLEPTRLYVCLYRDDSGSRVERKLTYREMVSTLISLGHLDA